ncbi:MAG: hypothetical protein HFJ27_04170 [Clostridia bacterium]|nr:hypothetical protein [Clostridia bacterium]
MKEQKTKIRKVCGFYTNDWHFTTMILPYVRNEISANNEIIAILQNSIKSNIKEILSKMNIKAILEQKILQINWEKTQPIKYPILKNTLLQKDGQDKDINILVNGDKEFIEKVNQNIEKIIQNENVKSRITILNYYDMTKDINIQDITSQYNNIINTAGIHSIEKKTQKEA